MQGPSRATGGGLLGSRQPAVRTPSQPPRVQGAPRIAGGTGPVQARNAIRSTAQALSIGQAARSGNPMTATGLMIAHDIMNKPFADGTLEGKTSAEMGRQQQGPPAWPSDRSGGGRSRSSG